jgi:HD-GYP domain-containing protein (c-di-GMP phosphodiesterase class II)
VRHRHERYDGTAYPQGLKGSEIPMMAQIMEVADAFDAMTTNRIYKARKSVEAAIAELQDLSGKQFDPEIVKVDIVVLADIEIERNVTQRPKTKMEQVRFYMEERVAELENVLKGTVITLTHKHLDKFLTKMIGSGLHMVK